MSVKVKMGLSVEVDWYNLRQIYDTSVTCNYYFVAMKESLYKVLKFMHVVDVLS